MKRTFLWIAVGFAAVSIAFLPGCASSQETAERDKLTENVGKYDPPPPGIVKARVGIPPFQVTESGQSIHNKALDDLAAEQMTTLALLSGRFEVIERAQLGQLLREQGLEGIVDPSQLARSGKVSGVDYLIFGKVTNLRIKAEKTGTGFNVGSIPIPFVSSTGFDYRNRSSKITAECGVDIRMVEPTTGRVAAAHFGEFKRTDSISAFGISILGVGADASAGLDISDDNKGKILRLALDDALRKMLPMVDQELLKLAQKKKAAAPAAPPPAPTSVSTPSAPSAGSASAASALVGAFKCPKCGKALQPGAKFCPNCGAKIPQPAATPQFCPNCGKQLKPGAKFCPNCGTKIGS